MQQQQAVTVQIEQSGGSSGRAFIILHEEARYRPQAQMAYDALAATAKVFKVVSSTIQTATWEALSDQLVQVLSQTGVRQFSIIAFGDASALAQNLYLREPKSIRAMVLIDATYRPHPTTLEKAIDWLECRFPLGLPLRSEGKQFNSLSHLQRIRCPVLIISSSEATVFDVAQSQEAAVRMPTSWHIQMDDLSTLASVVTQFQDTPAKCPQKKKSLAA